MRFHVSGGVHLCALDDGSAPAVYVYDAYGGDDDKSSEENNEELCGQRGDESECSHVEKPEVFVSCTIASGIANDGESASADRNELIANIGICSTIGLVP